MSSLALKPVAPFIQTVRTYSLRKFRADLVAGVTVAVVAVPQSMAYALIAGVPPVYGLYTAIVQGLLASLFTSSNQLSTGPINTLSLLVASSVARFVSDGLPEAERTALFIQLVIAMTFLVGLIQLAAAAARASTLVQYVSHSVIVGFTSGAGILIAAGQVPAFLGIATAKTRHLPGLLGIIERMLPHLHEVNWTAVWIGVGSLALIIVARMIWRFIPGPLLAAVGSAAIVAIMSWDQGRLQVVGTLPDGLPRFRLPDLSWQQAEALFGGAMALAIVGMLEAYSIAKSIAAKTGQKIDPNQEFLAQGFSNFLSSFFQCIPGSGSFSRSALNYQAGAQTALSGIINSVFIAIIFLIFAPQARFIPLASLAAILFIIAYGLVDWRYIVRAIIGSRPDAFVCLATLLATLLIPLEFAIIVGIFLNIGLYLRTASRLHMAQIVQTPEGPFAEVPIQDRYGQKQVLILQMEGDLFFGLADELQDRLGEIAKMPVRVVIFRLKGTHSMDGTVLHVLENFVREMRRRHRYVLICGLRPELRPILHRYGFLELLGKGNTFEAGFGVFTSTRRALNRARQLLGSSIDDAHVDVEEHDEMTYQI